VFRAGGERGSMTIYLGSIYWLIMHGRDAKAAPSKNWFYTRNYGKTKRTVY